MLKKNGLIIIIAPISWPIHFAPIDCRRVYPEGMKSIVDNVGCAELIISKLYSLERDNLNIDGLLTIPGKSCAPRNKKEIKKIHKWNNLIENIPFFRSFKVPIEVACDVISVIKKLN